MAVGRTRKRSTATPPESLRLVAWRSHAALRVPRGRWQSQGQADSAAAARTTMGLKNSHRSFQTWRFTGTFVAPTSSKAQSKGDHHSQVCRRIGGEVRKFSIRSNSCSRMVSGRNEAAASFSSGGFRTIRLIRHSKLVKACPTSWPLRRTLVQLVRTPLKLRTRIDRHPHVESIVKRTINADRARLTTLGHEAEPLVEGDRARVVGAYAEIDLPHDAASRRPREE